MEHYTALILPNTVSLVQEFCVDVSAYRALEWVEREGEECTTEFVQTCEERKENVCADVTETKCEADMLTMLDGG